MTPTRLFKPLLAAALALAALHAAALTRGIGPDGTAFASGGVSDEDQTRMRGEAGEFSFWLTTAVKGSGAYLSDIQVRITDLADQRLVLSTRMTGPWLMVALPPGRYLVDAMKWTGSAASAEVERRETAIDDKGQRKMVLYFSDPEAQTDPVPPAARASGG